MRAFGSRSQVLEQYDPFYILVVLMIVASPYYSGVSDQQARVTGTYGIFHCLASFHSPACFLMPAFFTVR